ncbi:MAG: hypothetical protein ACOYBJ_02185 [Patescibacteria group bacterium]|jgi:hypothetical protein
MESDTFIFPVGPESLSDQRLRPYMGGREVIIISSLKLLGAVLLTLVVLVAAGCGDPNTTFTTPAGVLVMESYRRAEITISTARWSADSSVQMELHNWMVILHPLQADKEGSRSTRPWSRSAWSCAPTCASP